MALVVFGFLKWWSGLSILDCEWSDERLVLSGHLHLEFLCSFLHLIEHLLGTHFYFHVIQFIGKETFFLRIFLLIKVAPIWLFFRFLEDQIVVNIISVEGVGCESILIHIILVVLCEVLEKVSEVVAICFEVFSVEVNCFVINCSIRLYRFEKFSFLEVIDFDLLRFRVFSIKVKSSEVAIGLGVTLLG